MSPIRDANLIVLTGDSVLSGTNPGGVIAQSFDMEGTVLKGMALHVVLPAAGGATPVMTINVYASTASAAATTDKIIASRSGINAAGEFVVPFSTNKRSVGFEFYFTSSSGNFSKAKAWVTLDYAQDWTRTIEFHA